MVLICSDITRRSMMIIDFRVRIPPKDFIELTKSLSFPSFLSQYEKLFKLQNIVDITLDDLVKQMEEAGITRAVLQAEFEYGDYKIFNQYVADAVEKYPDKFIGFGSVDPRDGMKAVREMERIVQDLGLRGLNLQPWVYGLPPNNKKYYPIYAKCVEFNIPVTVHVGINFSLNRSMNVGKPLYLDEVAHDFPELKIILNHVGWPWVTESIAVAWRHPNVFLEIGGVAPKYIAMPGTGWEPLLTYANSLLQDRILFATDWPVIPLRRAVNEVREWPVKEEVKEKIFYKNAQQILGL
jgi:predicted TIM-barrel fold metal-dependent hydrolase